MRMYLLMFPSVLLALYFILPGVQPIRWLAITRIVRRPATLRRWRRFDCSIINKKNTVFDEKQLEECKKKRVFMKYVVEAAQLAISECMRLTFHHRWYCKDAIKMLPRTAKDVKDGTKESAFLRALSTAALVFKITQGCALDKTCGCGRNPKRTPRRLRKRKANSWVWGECNDNIHRGIRFSRDFLDVHMSKEKGIRTNKLIMMVHNNEVARSTVRDAMDVSCHCPDVLNQTCVEECTHLLPINFSGIAEKMFKRYKRARQVELRASWSKKPNSNQMRREEKFVPKTRRRKKGKTTAKPINGKQLIYLYRSRDFCEPKGNLTGTRGRECARKVQNIKKGPDPFVRVLNVVDKCRYLCCGRPHDKKLIGPKKVGCQFKFSWRTMNVKNRTCDQVSTVSICR